ncbi:MAG: type II toxin-antitoxin system RatA family toxin [Thiohalomonadaceae bacterium]
MSRHSVSRLLPYRREQLFDLVLDIERYPEFVPGYSRARILRREVDALEVEQHAGFGPATFRFRSRAEFVIPERIAIRALDGPFRRLDVNWHFLPQDGGCLVTAETHYELAPLLAPLLQGGLALLAPRLLDAFARRAAELYGEPA